MVSTTLCSGDHGLLTQESLEESPCMLASRKPVESDDMLMVISVNWYQRNYPYAWAGARLVRD